MRRAQELRQGSPDNLAGGFFIHTQLQGFIAKRAAREKSACEPPCLSPVSPAPGRPPCVSCGRPGQLHGVVFSITHAHLREGLPASGSASTPPWSSYWALFAVSVGGGVVLGLLAVFVFKYQGTPTAVGRGHFSIHGCLHVHNQWL